MTSRKTYLVSLTEGTAPVTFRVKETFARSETTPAHTSGDDPAILNGDTRKVEAGVTENGTYIVCRTVYGQKLDADGDKVSTKVKTYATFKDFVSLQASLDGTLPEEAAAIFQMKDLPSWTGVKPSEI